MFDFLVKYNGAIFLDINEHLSLDKDIKRLLENLGLPYFVCEPNLGLKLTRGLADYFAIEGVTNLFDNIIFDEIYGGYKVLLVRGDIAILADCNLVTNKTCSYFFDVYINFNSYEVMSLQNRLGF